MAGLTVTRTDLDSKAVNTILALREALSESTLIFKWLADHPSNAASGDILTKPEEDGGFGYNADEAYLLRVLFEGINNLNTPPLLDMGRKLTGLS